MKDPTREKLDQALFEFHMKCLAKYDKGREEHNHGPIEDIDFDAEIENEIMDHVVYSLLRKMVKK